MTSKYDKKKRRQMVRAWRQEERDIARAALPLPEHLLREMFDMLSAEFPRQGCDQTLRLVRSWAEERGLDVDALEAWLHDNGGFCDCEALANAEEAFRSATRTNPDHGDTD